MWCQLMIVTKIEEGAGSKMVELERKKLAKCVNWVKQRRNDDNADDTTT